MADKRWASNQSRTARRVMNNLGVIWGEDVAKTKKYRKEELNLYDNYYEAKQYDKLIGWDEAAQRMCEDDDFIGVRKRKPRINVALHQLITSRLASKLVGETTFPSIEVEDDPDTSAFIRELVKWAKLKTVMMEPVRRMLNTGSEFVRFYYAGGSLKVQRYCSKYVYPEFNEADILIFARIQYVWTDYNDLDERGKPREKWYKLELGQYEDVLYDNPLYSPQGEPQFEEVERVKHDFGFVQGVWMRPNKNAHSPDGDAMARNLMDFTDEINYSLSQSSQAVSYNQEPVLTLSGMDTDEVDHVVKTSAKALNLGRDGKAEYLETNMAGVQTAMEFRDKTKTLIQDVARVALLDPEKIVGSAQSGKAMEVLHGPMVDYILELRPVVEEIMLELVAKIMLSLMILHDRGEEVAFEMPEGFQPSFDIKASWPEIFPMTLEDLQKKVSLGVSAASASVISRESVTRWLAKDFNIEDVDAEIAKVAAQPVINPFGGF